MANCLTTKKHHRNSRGKEAYLSFLTTTNFIIAPATHTATMLLRNQALGNSKRSMAASPPQTTTALNTILSFLSKKMQAISVR